MELSLLWSLERGLGIALQDMQERRPSSHDDGGPRNAWLNIVFSDIANDLINHAYILI